MFEIGAVTQLAVSTTLINITKSGTDFNAYDRKCWLEEEIHLEHFSYDEDYRYNQAWAKVDFLVTKTDQTIFLGLFSDQTNTNIQKWKLTISNNNNLYSSLKLQKQYFAKVHVVKPKTHK